ncbi:MAG: thioredoxin-disulfide reductase [Patescibacteria group bacterium]|nr:thioredoxin-disulfide reductase [Patescibacteria group bacterium]
MEEVIIIGGGPAGLSASLYLARANLRPVIFAGLPPGGQLMLTSWVENFPGHQSILGPALIQQMREQVTKFGGRIIDQNITKVNLNISKIKVETEEKNYTAKTLVIAVGAAALWLEVPGEQRLRGKGVSACATCDGLFFKNKVVAVVGGGDSAMEEALTLTKHARKVFIIHRRDKFRASKIMQERVFKNEKIEIIWNSVVKEVLGEDKVTGLKIVNLITSQEEILAVDGLFVAIGHRPATDVFQGKLIMDDKGYIVTSDRVAREYLKFKTGATRLLISQEKLEKIVSLFDFNYQTMTSVRGVFAAGDCVDFDFCQAGTAAGLGIMAALEVERYLES